MWPNRALGSTKPDRTEEAGSVSIQQRCPLIIQHARGPSKKASKEVPKSRAALYDGYRKSEVLQGLVQLTDIADDG
jgi:hypothetical protein